MRRGIKAFRKWKTERSVRRKARFEDLPLQGFEVHLARTLDELDAAFRLVYASYLYEGIERFRDAAMRMTEQHVLQESAVLVACEGKRVVGTVSVTLDSPAGLPLDKDYPALLSALREQGARISEIGSLMVVGRLRHSGLNLMLGAAAQRFGFHALQATHQVIGIHPRAAAYYAAVWGFRSLGAPRRHAQLSAPVTGMLASREQVETHLARYFRKRTAGGGGRDARAWVLGDTPAQGLSLDEGQPELLPPRWKMPRGVFQELFVRRTRYVEELSRPTLCHLQRQRSDDTLGTVPLPTEPTEKRRPQPRQSGWHIVEEEQSSTSNEKRRSKLVSR